MKFKNLKNLCLCLVLTVSSQFSHSQNNYHSPLGIPLVLSSNFGEIRPNHFHTGLDFKTNGSIGYRLYAIEEGYVSRIKISPYGYGRAVYIDHPNGITSVYAHISAFSAKLDSIILKAQEKEQNFAIDLYLKKDELKVSRGEIFAFSGNTGGSGGPHLHFELRDTKTEKALNPLLYGFDIADHRAPEMRNLKVYGLTEKGYRIPGKELEFRLTKSGSGYKLANSEITIPANFVSPGGGIGFAVDAIDRFDGASNPCGLFGTYLIEGNDTVFGQKINGVFFEESRYVNTHTDYEAYQSARKKYHKLFKTSENPLSIYTFKGSGIIVPGPENEKTIKIIAFDAAGNESVVQLKAKWNHSNVFSNQTPFSEKEIIRPDSDYDFEGIKGSIEVPENCVYEPVEAKFHEDDYLHLGNRNTPVQNAMEITILKSKPLHPVEKYYINVKSPDGKNHALDTEYKNGEFKANSNFFGTFQLFIDTLPPTVNFSSLKANQQLKSRTIKLSVYDSQTDIADYDLFIDGKWYPLEFETKGSYLIFSVPAEISGKHHLHIIVKDSCNNTSEFKEDIIF